MFNFEYCLPNEKRIGHIRLTNGGGLKKLPHSVGFSCIVYVDQKFNFIIDIDQTAYANIKECLDIRLIDTSDQKIYHFDPLIKSENKAGELIDAKLNLKYQNIKHEELENTLKNTPKGMLSRCIVDDKDLHIGINGDIYIFRNIFSRDGFHVDENRLKATLPVLLSVNLNAIDFQWYAALALDEQKYIKSRNVVTKTKEETLPTDELIAFRKCLVFHRNSSNIGAFNIPKVCEEHALTLELLGYGSKVNEMAAGFKKIMQPESDLP